MEADELIWEGRIGGTPLRVGVPHAGRIIAEWDAPEGPRHKVSDSVEEFERAVLFQLLLREGITEEEATEEVITAIRVTMTDRPTRAEDPAATRRRSYSDTRT